MALYVVYLRSVLTDHALSHPAFKHQLHVEIDLSCYTVSVC